MRRDDESQKGRASCWSAAPGDPGPTSGGWGKGRPQATWSHKQRNGLRVRALELLLESDVRAPCPPGSHLEVAAASPLGPGPESQAHTPIWREARRPSAQKRDLRERGKQAWLILRAKPSGDRGQGSGSCPRAGLRYSPASGPCLSFRASDRCLTRKSCS